MKIEDFKIGQVVNFFSGHRKMSGEVTVLFKRKREGDWGLYNVEIENEEGCFLLDCDKHKIYEVKE